MLLNIIERRRRQNYLHLMYQMLVAPLPLLLLLLLTAAGLGIGLEFNFDGSSDNANMITPVMEPAWYTGQFIPYYSNSSFWLTPDPDQLNSKADPNEGVVGRIVYKDPIPVPSSFTTFFTFRIITNGTYSESGSGMAFFISTSRQAPNNSIAGGLGLVYYQKVGPPRKPEFPFFAVEFDTRISPAYNDPSASHIGIDINSLVSANITDTSNSSSPFYPELYLYNNSTFSTWVDYSNGFIQVWMVKAQSPATAGTATRPSQPCVQLHYNLSNLFPSGQPVYVGFSSTNRPDIIGQEGAAIYSWSFSVPNARRSSHRLLLPLILSVAASLAVAGVICAGGFLIWRRRRPRFMSFSTGSKSRWRDTQRHLALTVSSIPRYSYRELRKAASGFSEKNKVGEGAYSKVYRGTLANGSAVAMKKLKDGLKMEAEVVSEIGIISKIRHRNLLQLEGWCYERGEAILVYKYMEKGSLERYVFGKDRGRLGSKERLRILQGVAAALEYLHGGLAMGECVMHRDVKAANVLLTEEWEAVLGDFGLARLIKEEGKTMTLTVAGTPGYVAPEVVYNGRGTSKADVYSWGVLALEVACGRPAMDQTLEERRLLNWVWMNHENDRLLDALDASLRLQNDEEASRHWRCILHLALVCCHPSPDLRPSMRDVCHVLHHTILLPLPANYTSPSCHDWILADGASSATFDSSDQLASASSIQLAGPDSMSMERLNYSSSI